MGNVIAKMSKREIEDLLRYIACFIPPEYIRKLKSATTCHEKFRIYRQFSRYNPQNKPEEKPLPAKGQLTKKEKKRILHFINEKFTVGDYEGLICPLNELICDAIPFSPAISQLFTKRSVAFFKMGLHEDCFKNISLTIQHKDPTNYGPPVMDYVVNLKDELDLLMEDYEIDKRKIKLSYPAKPNNSFLIDDLELKYTGKYGMGIFTKIDLHIGDIILMEKPFTWALADNQIYSRCTYCLRENDHDLIPCTTCSKAMFCGIECQNKAISSFHKNECAIIENGLKMSRPAFAVTTTLFRMIRLIIWVFKGDARTMIAWYNDPKKYENFNPFAVNCVEHNAMDLIRLLFMLREGFYFPENEYSLYSGLITIYEHLAMEDKSITLVFDTDDKKDFLFDLLVDFMKILVSRPFYLTSFVPSNKEEETEEPECFMQSHMTVHALGIFVFANYFNHSCLPNVTTSTNAGEIVCTVIAPVKAGEELTISYDGVTASEFSNTDERRKKTRERRCFVCKCDACEKNFKRYKEPLNSKQFPLVFNSEYKTFEERQEIYKQVEEYANSLKKKGDLGFYSCVLENMIKLHVMYDMSRQ